MDEIQLLRWENQYLKSKENYLGVCQSVCDELGREIRAASLKCDVSYRVKSWESVIEKVTRKSYNDPFSDIEDFSGVRCTAIFSDDLPAIERIIRKHFNVVSVIDKRDELGDDRMGYLSKHFIVSTPDNNGQKRKCEIQVRTSLENAWADLSHTLAYKKETRDESGFNRKINNISSALEVIQDQVDAIRRGMQKEYTDAPKINQGNKKSFDRLLGREIKSGLLARYCAQMFGRYVKKGAPMDMILLNKAISDLPEKYQTIRDIDAVVKETLPAVIEYQAEEPDLFPGYVDYLTKCLIFADDEFLKRHGPAQRTRLAALAYRENR